MNNHPSAQTVNFLNRLQGVRKTSGGWQACCPCRDDDNNPSLSIGQGDDGRTLLKCHRGISCDVEKICTSVGLRVSDLMPQGDKPSVLDVRSFGDDRPVSINTQQKQAKAQSKTKFVESYDYTDELGNLLFQKIRLVDENGRKTFRQRKPDGNGGWVYSASDVRKVLYNLPNVIKAKEKDETIWVVEGEKDANTLIGLGQTATTMPNGAGSWLDIHTEMLQGAKTIEIISDNDDVGIQHAVDVCRRLRAAGCEAQVWVPPVSKDITDHLEAGKTISELEPVDDEDISVDHTALAHQVGDFEEAGTEESSVGEISSEDEAIHKLQSLLLREDLSSKIKLAKSSLIISSSGSGSVLDAGRLVQWNDLLAESDKDTYEWVIPNIIEKSERVIVVAAEGVGKTMLARQVAILSSSGIHPFSYQPMRPVRTLTIDLENPDTIIRRTSRKIANVAMTRSGSKRLDAYLYTKPSGMDLLKNADRALLENALEEIQPELLLIGPLYKAFVDPGSRTSESVAVEIAKYLDQIRVVYGCALWLEHHAPLGATGSSRDLRPFGSAVWSRWPEFGISLQPDPMVVGQYGYDIKHFRGARDERNWPTKMKRGGMFPFEVTEWAKLSDER